MIITEKENHYDEAQIGQDLLPNYPDVPMSALILFCVYVMIWFLQIGNRISLLGTIRLELVLACVLIVMSRVMGDGKPLNYDSKLLKSIIIYFVLLVVMTIFSYNFNVSLNVFIDRVVKFSFMAYFIVSFVKSPLGMRFFLGAFMLVSFKIGLEGLVGQLTGSMVWLNQGIMRLHGSTMLFRHPNSFTSLALAILPFLIYLYPIANKWIKIFLLVQFVFVLNIILHTGSRTGYVAFIGVVCIVVWRSRHRLKVFLLCVLLAAIAVNYLPMQYKNRFLSIFISSNDRTFIKNVDDKSLHGGDGSKRARKLILQDALAIFAEHPYGIGVSAFPSIRMDKFGRFQDTHNLYLEIATNLGIQGCVVWGMFIFFMFKSMLGAQKETRYQIKRIQLLVKQEKSDGEKILSHLVDLQLLNAVSNISILFLSVRLILGFFGHDLYEIYWWFICGITISVEGMLKTSANRTEFFVNRASVC